MAHDNVCHYAALAQQEPSTAAPVTFCFSFFDQPDCDSFTTALQTMLLRQQKAIKQAQQAAEQQAAVQQPQSQHAGADAVSAAAADTHACAEGSRPTPDSSTAAAAMELQEEARAAIKVCFGERGYEAPVCQLHSSVKQSCRLHCPLQPLA